MNSEKIIFKYKLLQYHRFYINVFSSNSFLFKDIQIIKSYYCMYAINNN